MVSERGLIEKLLFSNKFREKKKKKKITTQFIIFFSTTAELFVRSFRENRNKLCSVKHKSLFLDKYISNESRAGKLYKQSMNTIDMVY